MRLLLALLLLATALSAQTATINVVNQDNPGEGLNDPTPASPVGGNTGTTLGQQRRIVMERAAALWGARLGSAVTIQVGAEFNALECSDSSAVLGSAGPRSVIRDFAGAPEAGTYYPIALANSLAGTDLDPANVDIEAEFNSNLGKPGCLPSVPWYYGLDGQAPAGSIDFLMVVLHEYGHGLGFLSTVDLSTGARLNGFNDSFMLHLEDHSTGKLYPDMTDAERLVATTDNGDLHWVGTNVVSASDFLATGRDLNGHVLMYAPNPVEPGSSVSHFDVSLSPNELMEPFATAVNDRRLTEELFRDLGWNVLPPIQTNGQVLLAETCSNGAIDPGETVTVELTLRNMGFANVGNLTATLLPINGVTNPGAPQNYGAMPLLGNGVTRSFTFTANGQCGDVLRPTLQLQDGSIDYGTVSFAFRAGRTREYTNTSSISLPNSGAASPFPSTLTISNYAGTLNGLEVRLANINHSSPDDIDILLVGPGGQKLLLMSDSGGGVDLTSGTLTFSDAAGGNLPDTGLITSGTYRPTNHGATADTFSAPAPGAPYATSLSVFNGTNPNGTWQLFVMDDANPTSGSISGGWVLILPDCCALSTNQPPTLAVSPAPVAYVENGPPLAIAAEAVVTDADSPTFNAGTLTVALATNGTAADQLGIRDDGSGPGAIGLSANTVLFEGLDIGTYTGGANGSTLSISFTSTNATVAAIQALCRAVTFFNVSDAPSTNARSARFTLTDGSGEVAAATKTVMVTAVNDPPTIGAVVDQLLAEDGSTGALPFLIGDAESPAGALAVSVTSSNVALVPLSNIVLGGAGSNRTVTIQPATNQSGTSLITLHVTDGALTNSTSFLLTVTPVNDAPVISSLGNQSIPEDTSTAALNFAVGDAETAAGSLVVSALSSNLTLVPLSNIILGGTDSNRTVTIHPATNQIGTTLIMLHVTDGSLTNNTAFLLTVTSINDAPAISSVPNQSVAEDQGTGSLPFLIGDVETPPDSLIVSVASSNLTLVPLSNILLGGVDSNRMVTIQPATNQFGTSLITLHVTDGALTNSTSFLLTVTPVNDAPVISSLGNQSIPEDTSTAALNFAVGDAETAAGSLVVSALSSNLALVPLSNIVLGGVDSNRTVSIQPATNQFGTSLITLRITDGALTNSTSFVLSVTPVNDPPAISSIPDQSVAEDETTGPIPFLIGDAETPAGALIVSVTSSNLTLAPLSNIVLGGADSSRTVTITPAGNELGTSLIRLFVSDGEATNITTFLLTVTDQNDGPSISAVPDQATIEDMPTAPIAFSIGDLETAAGNLILSATSSNALLVPVSNILFGGSDSNRTATIRPTTNQSGTTLISLRVSDGDLTNSRSFLLTVSPVNDAPQISSITNQVVTEDAGTGPLPFAIADVDNDAAALVVTATSSNLTLVPPANLLFSGADANRAISVLPATNAFGTTLITLFVSDGEQSNSTSFLVTVLSENDPPSISVVPDSSSPEDTQTEVQFTIGDVETPAGGLLVSATSSNLVLLPPTNIFFSGFDANRTAVLVPATNEYGTTMITLAVSDGESTMTNTFLLIVAAVNDPPLITPVSDVTILEDGSAGPIAFVVSDVEEPAALLTVTAISSKAALVPEGGIALSGSASNRSVTIFPATNQSGAATITLAVSDGQATNSAAFVLTVTPVNDAPVISPIGNQFSLEDTVVGPIPFFLGDADHALAALAVWATSSNETLVSVTNIVLTGSASDRNIALRPGTNQFGSTLITIFVSDGEGTNSASFLLSLAGVNDVPTISPVPDQIIAEDTSTGPLSVTIGDVETTSDDLIVAATSSNPGLVSLTNIVLSGAGSNRTVTIVPATNQVGTSTITLFVSDGQATNSTSFTLTVTELGDAPNISSMADVVILEDHTSPGIPFTIGDAEAAAETLTVWAMSSETNLVPVTNILFSGSASNRFAIIQPAANEFGSTVLTFFVTDGTATNSTSFLVTVLPVNDAPTINSITNVTVTANAGPFPIDLAGLTAGPTNELQTFSVSASVSDPLLLAEPVVIHSPVAPSGSLILTPIPNAAGTSVVSVVVSDTGGTASGGIDAATNTFTVIVLPVADLAVLNDAAFTGTNLHITVTLTNLGPHTARDVHVTNQMPHGTTVLSVISDGGMCVSSNGSVICTLTSLPPNTSASVSLTLAVEPQRFFTNVTFAGTSDIDANQSNNVAVNIVTMGGEQDFDGDGMPDWWELANATDPRVPDGGLDPDVDRLTNLQEYLAGTNPQDAASVLRITRIALEDGSDLAILSFLAISNRAYSILGSSNLAGSWIPLMEVTAAQDGVMTVTNAPSLTPVRFFRVVTPP